MRQRFEEFAARVGEAGHRKARPEPHARPALEEGYWQALRELFTRDLTPKQLQEFLEHETTDTFRFFTREVDLASLHARPWYARYPLAAWRVFLAMAHRLSPPRRLLFAVGVPLLALGWIRYAAWVNPWAFTLHLGYSLVLAAATLLFVLLCLELKDKLTLKGDLEIARTIQFGLLPFEPYDHGGLAVQASMRPANTVGGDYFDLVELGAGRLGVVVGDVAGKGMPAALLMALLQGSLRTLITAGLRGDEMVAKLNAHLCANIPPNRLVTLFYGEVDPEAGRIRYVNAGHNAPYLLRADGTVERLAATAVALGVMPDAAFTLLEADLEPGDRMLLYTDGVVEAFNPKDEEYGEGRLRAFLEAQRSAAPRALLDGLIEDVLRFCGAARPRDDMTLLVLDRARVTSPSAPEAGRSS